MCIRDRVCWDSVYSYSFVRFKYRVDSIGSTYYNIGGSGVFSPLLCKQKNGLVPNTSYRLIYRTWCNSTGGAYRSPVWDGPVFFSTPSNIRESNNNSRKIFEMFPNPSRGKFSISINDQLIENRSLSIYNTLGELILEIYLHHDQFVYNFDLSTYSKGIYTVVFKSESDQYHEKIIVQ